MNIDLNAIDWQNVGSWPKELRYGAVVLAFLAVCGLGYHFHISKQIETHKRTLEKQAELKTSFIEKQHQAVQLDVYRGQLHVIHSRFGELLRQLPEETEVPGLVEDISHQGLASGLSLSSIKLQPEQEVDFYSELPIEIVVEGDFHQIAQFVSNIAGLPRIVTLHDFDVVIEDGDQDRAMEALSFKVLAKTYRYNDRGGDDVAP